MSKLRIVLLGGVAAATVAAADARHHGSKSGGNEICRSLSLDTSGPRPATILTTAGGHDFPVVFDSGAMKTTVNIAFAQRLGLANEGKLHPPFDKHATGFQTTIRGARLGTVALPDVSVAAIPIPLPEKAAIISPDLFSGELVQLDLAAAILRICPNRAPFRPAGTGQAYSPGPFILPVISLTIAGRKIDGHADTGSPFELIMPMRYARQFDLAEPLRKVGVARSHAGEKPIYKARLKGDVLIANMTLSNPELAFSDVVPNVNVGTPWLRQMVLTFDPAAQRSWITAAN